MQKHLYILKNRCYNVCYKASFALLDFFCFCNPRLRQNKLKGNLI